MKQSSTGAASGNIDFQELVEIIKGLDNQQIEKDFKGIEESVKKAIEEKKGETETGEFAVDGFTFTSKTPVNMTFEELMEIEINSVKEMLGKDSIKPLVDVLSTGMDISTELDKALMELRNQPAENKYNLDLAIYEDENASKYYAAILTREATKENINFGFGTVDGFGKLIAHAVDEQAMIDIAFSGVEGGAFEVKASILSRWDSMNITGTGDADGNIDITYEIVSSSTPAKFHVTTTVGEDARKNFNVDVFFIDNEKPLMNISGSAGEGGEIMSAFEGENISVIPFSKLMEGDQNTMTTLGMTAVTNLMKGINILTKNLPAETATWVTSLFSSLLGGATQY